MGTEDVWRNPIGSVHLFRGDRPVRRRDAGADGALAGLLGNQLREIVAAPQCRCLSVFGGQGVELVLGIYSEFGSVLAIECLRRDLATFTSRVPHRPSAPPPLFAAVFNGAVHGDGADFAEGCALVLGSPLGVEGRSAAYAAPGAQASCARLALGTDGREYRIATLHGGAEPAHRFSWPATLVRLSR